MLTVHKQTLEITDNQILIIPKNAEVLCVQTQHEQPQIWYKCDNSMQVKEFWEIYIHGTGHKITDPRAKYIGTFQIRNGQLVFHVFMRKQ